MNKSDFEIFSYKTKTNVKYQGIAFKKNLIKIGSKKDLDKFQYFKFDEEVPLLGKTGWCAIALHSSIYDRDEIDSLIDLICVEYKKNSDISLSEIFNALNKKFEKTKYQNCTKQYIGLFCELMLIYYCQTELDFEIIDNYQRYGKDLFDFHFDKTDIEIKYITKQNQTITVSDRQLKEIHANDQNAIIAINLEQNSVVGSNLIQLLNRIVVKNSNTNNFEHLQTRISELYKICPEIFEELKYDLGKTSYVVLNHQQLPKITFDKNGEMIASALFKLNVGHWSDNNQKIRTLIGRLKYGK